MEAVYSSQISMKIYRNTCRYIPEDRTFESDMVTRFEEECVKTLLGQGYFQSVNFNNEYKYLFWMNLTELTVVLPA
jgi:hypothetical protein